MLAMGIVINTASGKCLFKESQHPIISLVSCLEDIKIIPKALLLSVLYQFLVSLHNSFNMPCPISKVLYLDLHETLDFPILMGNEYK